MLTGLRKVLAKMVSASDDWLIFESAYEPHYIDFSYTLGQ